MPFLSSLLIYLYYKSVNGVSCTKTNISVGGDCLIDMPVEVRWFSVTGCFWGRPRPHFTASLAGFWGTSKVGKSASSLSSLAGASSLSSLTGASSLSSLISTSSLSGLILQVFLG